jgi:hypothetical protein
MEHQIDEQDMYESDTAHIRNSFKIANRLFLLLIVLVTTLGLLAVIFIK